MLRRPQIQRFTALVLLPMLTCAGVGVAIVPIVKKDRAEPFPCQDCACACHNAQSCWQSCCCHTDGEKIAWAEKAGVIPPLFVLERHRDTQLAAEPSPTPGCSTCTKERSSAEPLRSEKPSASATDTRIVLLSAQTRCQGMLAWLAILEVALPSPPAKVIDSHSESSPLARSFDASYLPPAFTPPEPPPRLVV